MKKSIFIYCNAHLYSKIVITILKKLGYKEGYNFTNEDVFNSVGFYADRYGFFIPVNHYDHQADLEFTVPQLVEYAMEYAMDNASQPDKTNPLCNIFEVSFSVALETNCSSDAAALIRDVLTSADVVKEVDRLHVSTKGEPWV